MEQSPEFWIITKDHLVHMGYGDDAGTIGPSTAPDGITKEDPCLTVQFQLFDDDGNLYYTGKMTENADFAPLDDFGTPNAGCTYMKYRKGNDKWQHL